MGLGRHLLADRVNQRVWTKRVEDFGNKVKPPPQGTISKMFPTDNSSRGVSYEQVMAFL